MHFEKDQQRDDDVRDKTNGEPGRPVISVEAIEALFANGTAFSAFEVRDKNLAVATGGTALARAAQQAGQGCGRVGHWLFFRFRSDGRDFFVNE
jgi:hypothetical protein